MNTALLPTPRAEISASLGWWAPGADLRSLFLLQCVPSVHKHLAPVAQEQAVGVSGSAGRAPHGQGEQPEPAATSVLETAPPLLGAGCVACPSRAALLFAPSCSVSSSLLWLWGHRRGCSSSRADGSKLLSGPPPLTRLQCADAVQTAVGHP